MATPTTARSAPRTAALLHPLAVAAALRLAATDASADVRYEGGGDCAGVPMYRALNYGYIYDSASSDNGKGSAEGRIGFFASPETGHSCGELFDGGFEGTLSETGAADYSWTLPTVALGTPINLYFWTSAFVALLPGDLDVGSGTTITADYSRTIVLEGVDLYDADDNLLSDWSMVDTDSGTLLFNADGRQAPVLPPVPEPGTWSMMLGGLLSMGWMRRRRVGVRAES